MKAEPANDPMARTHLSPSRKLVVGLILLLMLVGVVGIIAWLSGWAQAIPEGAEKAPTPVTSPATP